MTREYQVEKMLDELEEEFAKANMPVNDKLTLFAKVSNIIYKYAEQEPCEDKYIKVPKKALKYRTAGMVAYNAEWLKNHFNTERAVICGVQEPCDDCISRQAAIDGADAILARDTSGNNDVVKAMTAWKSYVEGLPPVTLQPKMGHNAFGYKKQIDADVLDKIRTEIEAKCCITVGRENDGAITLHDVFEIIDKYKA